MEYFVRVLDLVAFRPDKVCKSNLFDSARMFCDVYGFEPGQSQASHTHAESDKVYVVLQGEGWFSVGDQERNVGPGTAVFAPAGMSHAVRNPGPERLVVLVFMAPKPRASG